MRNGPKSTLFSGQEQEKLDARAPLAVRMRPKTLEEFAGQEHFIGPDKLLRRMLEAGSITSLLFYGPPGSGTTMPARIAAGHIDAMFHYHSAPPLNSLCQNLMTRNFRDAYAETLSYTSNQEVRTELRVRGLGLNPLINIWLSSNPNL